MNLFQKAEKHAPTIAVGILSLILYGVTRMMENSGDARRTIIIDGYHIRNESTYTGVYQQSDLSRTYWIDDNKDGKVDRKLKSTPGEFRTVTSLEVTNRDQQLFTGLVAKLQEE